MSNLIEEGYYNAVVSPVTIDGVTVKAQFGKAKTGTRQIAVAFEILDGPEAGRKITWFGYFTDGATKRTVESLRYCGFKGDDLGKLNDQALDQQVSITVEHEEDQQGKMRAKVAWVNGGGGGGVKLADPMKGDDLKRFAAEMRIAVRGVGEQAGEKAERGKSGTPLGGDDLGDDPSTDTRRGDGGGQQRGSMAPADDDIPFIYQE